MNRVQVSPKYHVQLQYHEDRCDDEEEDELLIGDHHDDDVDNENDSSNGCSIVVDDNLEDDVDISDVSSNESEPLVDNNEIFQDDEIHSECDGAKTFNNKHENNQFLAPKSSIVFQLIIILSLFVFPLSLAYFSLNSEQNEKVSDDNLHVMIDFKQIEDLPKSYPYLSLTSKDVRTIKARLLVMQREISVLMLIGRHRDISCKSDPTHCIARDIANSLGSQYKYFDGSLSNSSSVTLGNVLSKSFNSGIKIIIIDELEKLPGAEVMDIFQYIDRIEEIDTRRGMILFIVYTGIVDKDQFRQKLSADLAEKILVDSWSTTIPKDKLTSVISRMCRSIIKID